jgi:hypothetical protein
VFSVGSRSNSRCVLFASGSEFSLTGLFKDVSVHAQFHIIDKSIPTQCSNTLCSNPYTLQYPNVMTLCPPCFRPFYSSRHDPGNAKLYQSLVGAYHLQLMQGCGKVHCLNPYCLNGGNGTIVGREKTLDPTEAALVALDLFNKSRLQGDDSDGKPEYFLCVSDPQRQRGGTRGSL